MGGVGPGSGGDGVVGYVYFVYCPELDRFKIGWSLEHPGRRFMHFDVGSPAFLEKRSLMRAERHVESRLHSRFRKARFKGEWFRSSPELLEYIARNATPWDELLASELEAMEDEAVALMERDPVGPLSPVRRAKPDRTSRAQAKRKPGRPPKPVVPLRDSPKRYGPLQALLDAAKKDTPETAP